MNISPMLKSLKQDKIKINWNKNPISMQLFLSFLTVPVVVNTKHLGYDTGWTQYRNDDIKLVISGGKYDGGEWIDHLEYGKNLDNPYNNYVNPFYLFDILTDEGKAFFVSYYMEDINKAIQEVKWNIESLGSKLKKATEVLSEMQIEFETLTTTTP